jgi:hypothetical protein
MTALVLLLNREHALQAQHTAWMGSTWDKMNGETVEKQVTSAYKTLYKMGKVSLSRPSSLSWPV